MNTENRETEETKSVLMGVAMIVGRRKGHQTNELTHDTTYRCNQAHIYLQPFILFLAFNRRAWNMRVNIIICYFSNLQLCNSDRYIHSLTADVLQYYQFSNEIVCSIFLVHSIPFNIYRFASLNSECASPSVFMPCVFSFAYSVLFFYCFTGSLLFL